MRPSRFLILLVTLVLLLSACADEPPAIEPTRPAANNPTTAVEAPDAAADPSGDEPAEAGSWLIMLYGNADDEILEQDIFTDINEAELVGSSEMVTIVAQLDRYDGAFDGDGDWTGTKRFLITQDDDLEAIGSEELEDLGESDMAEGETLTDFVVWAADSYPADNYVLILSDHGMGWPGGWNDPDPPEPGPDGLALTVDGDLLLLNEMSAAIGAARDIAGIDQFELIGFDACLMGHIEVLAAMAPHTRYVVASQEVEPAVGWAYAAFLGELSDNPAMDGAELSETIVATYIDQDQRIVDDEARAAFAEETFGTDEASAEDVAAELGIDITLSAYDTAMVPDLLATLDVLAYALNDADQYAVAEARTYAQSFENVFSEDGPSPYIDLGHFAELLHDMDDESVSAAVDALLAALGETVIAERHGDDRPGATGLSIYFPDSELYEGEASGADAYATVSDNFAIDSLWENYLNSHYFGADLGADVTPSGSIDAPGASEITVAELELSADEINIADTVIVSTEVSGEYIGFIYAFVGYYNPEDDTILIADSDYIDAGESREVGGVFYPDWGDEGGVLIEYEWEPIIYGIDDGVGDGVSFALLAPEDYGAADDSATYSVDGMYTFASGEQRYARLSFKDGELLKIVAFSGQSAQGAPRVIAARSGDSFTIYDQYILLNSDSDDPEEYYQEEGATLTFGDEPWSVEVLTAPTGDYVLGIQAEDLDGNLYEAYTSVFVNE
ncbi:MAG: hypothetical protein HC822_26560 [Oscillochloris sp.]|nr:hypothetical protein [Oscillochloris sp.]